jgi:hypothetical protein
MFECPRSGLEDRYAGVEGEVPPGVPRQTADS